MLKESDKCRIPDEIEAGEWEGRLKPDELIVRPRLIERLRSVTKWLTPLKRVKI